MQHLQQRALGTLERRCPAEQLVQQHAQTVDVAARVDIGLRLRINLFRAHVQRRAEHPAAGLQGVTVDAQIGGSRNAEVDHLRGGLAVFIGHQHVRRFQIAVDDALLVRVLDRCTHAHHDRHTCTQIELVGVAVVDDGWPRHPLHGEIGIAGFGRAGIVDLRDARMAQSCQGLPLQLEAANETRLAAIAAHELQRDDALHRCQLFGAVDRTEAAFAQHFDQSVALDLRPGVGWRRGRAMRIGRLGILARPPHRHRVIQKPATLGPLCGAKQAFDFGAQGRFTPSLLLQAGLARRPVEIERSLVDAQGLARTHAPSIAS